VHEPWTDVADYEMRAFLGLSILAGIDKSNHEPMSYLWSEQEGISVFTATRYIDKATRESRQATDKLAPFRDIWMMFTA